jgi:hypothetical protein
MSRVRLEVELEVRPRDLKDLAEDYAREGTDAIFKYWTAELRGSRLVTEMASEEEDEDERGNSSDEGGSTETS